MRYFLIAIYFFLSVSIFGDPEEKVQKFYKTPEQLGLAVMKALKKETPDEFIAMTLTEIDLQRWFNTLGIKDKEALNYQLNLLEGTKYVRKLNYEANGVKYSMLMEQFCEIKAVDLDGRYNPRVHEAELKRGLWKLIMKKDFKLNKIKVRYFREHLSNLTSAAVYFHIKGKWCINIDCIKTNRGWAFLGERPNLTYWLKHW